ncbi:hypothetical protein NKH77_51500 [Streptomyces sp. M19]
MLDDLLTGLWWGENVVWTCAERDDVHGLAGALLAGMGRAPVFGRVLLLSGPDGVALASDRPGHVARFAPAGPDGGDPASLTARLAGELGEARAALVVDVAGWPHADRAEGVRELSGLARWALAQRAVVIWLVPATGEFDAVRGALSEFAQCGLSMRDRRIRVEKAEGARRTCAERCCPTRWTRTGGSR